MPKPPLKKTQHKFFDRPKEMPKEDVEQTITINITVNEKQDDSVADCFKSLFSCAKKAAS